jgi:ATP-dependent protease ClpP protease subunit
MHTHPSKQGIKGDKHTLFIEPVVQQYNNYRIFIGPFEENSNSIDTVWNSLMNATPKDTLELRIASPGGKVTECQMYVNIMRNTFTGRTTAYIDSHASSAGAFVFCAADKRVVYANSRLMLHNYSGGHGGKHQDMKDRMEFDEKHIIGFLESTITVGKNGFLTNKEFKHMIHGKNWWFDTTDMCQRGIATHVIINGKEMTSKEYLKIK